MTDPGVRKHQPRRASSFAFGEVSPTSTPLHSLFATAAPSVLKSANSSPTLSPVRSRSHLLPSYEESSHSDSETTKKRKATWDPPPTLRPRPRRIVIKKEKGVDDVMEPPKVGQVVAVRAEGGGFWLARVTGFYSDVEVDLQWMDEIKSHHNYFVQLDWYDTISILAVFKTNVKMDNLKKIGILKLFEEERELLLSLL